MEMLHVKEYIHHLWVAVRLVQFPLPDLEARCIDVRQIMSQVLGVSGVFNGMSRYVTSLNWLVLFTRLWRLLG